MSCYKIEIDKKLTPDERKEIFLSVIEDIWIDIFLDATGEFLVTIEKKEK
jgi:hypothetical protein